MPGALEKTWEGGTENEKKFKWQVSSAVVACHACHANGPSMQLREPEGWTHVGKRDPGLRAWMQA